MLQYSLSIIIFSLSLVLAGDFIIKDSINTDLGKFSDTGTFLTSGNIGIGTTTMVSKIHLKQPSNNTAGGMAFEESASGSRCFIFAVTTLAACPIGASSLDVGSNLTLCAQCN